MKADRRAAHEASASPGSAPAKPIRITRAKRSDASGIDRRRTQSPPSSPLAGDARASVAAEGDTGGCTGHRRRHPRNRTTPYRKPEPRDDEMNGTDRMMTAGELMRRSVPHIYAGRRLYLVRRRRCAELPTITRPTEQSRYDRSWSSAILLRARVSAGNRKPYRRTYSASPFQQARGSIYSCGPEPRSNRATRRNRRDAVESCRLREHASSSSSSDHIKRH